MNAAALAPRTPVLVGIGTSMQREDDFSQAREPLDLMIAAAQAAVADAGVPALGARVQRILVPKGRWRYADPGRAVGAAIGAVSARSVLAEVGVLQQTLIADACSRIVDGDVECALVAGADAGYRILRSRIAGQRAPERQQDSAPDEHLRPEEELLHPAELAAGIRMPAALYAVIDSAWRARHGVDPQAHRSALARMYEGFAAIAAANPEAWRTRPVTAADIAQPSERNPPQAFPYNRLHCASWNVDQGSALLLCAAQTARSLGVPPERWVLPLASAESNHMRATSARADIARAPGADLAAQALLAHAGLQPSQLDLLDLYSCFPVAVLMHAQALGVAPDRPLTVTGGMPFAGGPFNNYVLHATCRMAHLLRSAHPTDPPLPPSPVGSGPLSPSPFGGEPLAPSPVGSETLAPSPPGGGLGWGRGRARSNAIGVVSSVSGVLTKHGFGLWSREPGTVPFASIDVTGAAAAADPAREVLAAYDGELRVLGCTVLPAQADQPASALVLGETPAGARAWARSRDAAWTQAMQQQDQCGRTIRVAGHEIQGAAGG